MTWMAIGLKATGVLLAVATLLPFVPSNSGFIRTFDFPRLQIAALIVPVILGLVLVARDTTGLTLAAALVAALAYQVACIYPFTRLVSPQAVAAEAGASRTEAGVSILIANVLESNRSYGPILDLVVAQDPDLLLLVETDAAWAEALEPLRARYPHVVAQPQDNTYGLMFYSKLPMTDPQVRFLLQDDVPSVRTGVTLRSGQTFTFFGVHPRPPHPGQSSTLRDAELVMVAR
jgi:endonuclease/exonuclease/phosphatase (EEP) superfamily protein YafD